VVLGDNWSHSRVTVSSTDGVAILKLSTWHYRSKLGVEIRSSEEQPTTYLIAHGVYTAPCSEVCSPQRTGVGSHPARGSYRNACITLLSSPTSSAVATRSRFFSFQQTLIETVLTSPCVPCHTVFSILLTRRGYRAHISTTPLIWSCAYLCTRPCTPP
jgi:hypothetical protein